MELKAHYLVKIRGVDDLTTDYHFPHWVTASLHRSPFVVIRRAENKNGCVPVGIRGRERGQTCAAWLSPDKAVDVITPYSLVCPNNWKAAYSIDTPATVRSLQLVTPLMQGTGYKWGPTGSTGFELATGAPTLRDTSDLDLLIDVPEILNITLARGLMDSLEKMALVRLDIQMNTPRGGVAFKEYIRSKDVLIKTSTGPVIQHTHSLWS